MKTSKQEYIAARALIKAYESDKKEKRSDQKKEWELLNKEDRKEAARVYAQKNKEKKDAYNKMYRENPKNKKKKDQYNKDYQSIRKEKNAEKNPEYFAAKAKRHQDRTDVENKIIMRVRLKTGIAKRKALREAKKERES